MADLYHFPPDPQPERPAPKREHIATFFRAIGASGRPMICSSYRTATGIELTIAYSDTDVVRVELFRGPDRDERVADRASIWRAMLIEKGFTIADA